MPLVPNLGRCLQEKLTMAQTELNPTSQKDPSSFSLSVSYPTSSSPDAQAAFVLLSRSIPTSCRLYFRPPLTLFLPLPGAPSRFRDSHLFISMLHLLSFQTRAAGISNSTRLEELQVFRASGLFSSVTCYFCYTFIYRSDVVMFQSDKQLPITLQH